MVLLVLKKELHADELRYFEPLKETKNSSKEQGFEIADRKWLKKH